MRTYIQWCELLNKLSGHSYDARTPAQKKYWDHHRAKLAMHLRNQGWKF